MYLLDEPYISDFLIETVRRGRSPVIGTNTAKRLLGDVDLHWICEEEAAAILQHDSSRRLYTNSENALDWVAAHMKGSPLSRQINILKDKARFRKQVKQLFPSYRFQSYRSEDLWKIGAEDLVFPFVIKPSIGFLSIGVYIVKDEQDWKEVLRQILSSRGQSLFPKSVLDASHFIIEEYIEGEEYAVDYYYNDVGDVVILSVLHHVFSSEADTSDRVYSTSKAIIEQHEEALRYFLFRIGARLNLRNFPAHAEVRIDASGNILPIEINPLRFGGWCTTADLSGIALGLNVYDSFFNNTSPDWGQLFGGKEDKIFSVIVLDNNSGIAPEAIARFDYEALADDFANPLLIRRLDFEQYPLFGFAFVETDADHPGELCDILRSDLRKYIHLKD